MTINFDHPYFHFSEAQKSLVREFASLPDKPTWDEYMEWHDRMQAISPTAKLKQKDIPNTRKGYEGSELVPLDNFNAKTDLPEGYGLVSMLDSGGNHKVTSAGCEKMRWVFNSRSTGHPYRFDIYENR